MVHILRHIRKVKCNLNNSSDVNYDRTLEKEVLHRLTDATETAVVSRAHPSSFSKIFFGKDLVSN